MNEIDLKPYVKAFAKEVHAKAKEIDPDNKLDWLALSLGWALAKGLAPEDAAGFAIYVRYHTNYG